MSIDLNKENQEPTEDDLYLAKMTMDEVGADIDEHGHIAVTDDNRTQDPFTTKGSLANALDEALDYSNPNYDPTNESQGEVEGVTQDPQNDSPKSSNTEMKPDDTTMDKAPELPESMDNDNEKPTKDSLAEALDSVVAMDAVTEVPGDADDDAHHKWEKNEIDKRVPTLPKSLGGEEKTDGNGLVYLEYTFTVDPEKYRSANYQPIANAADAQGGSEPNLVTKEQLFSSVSNDKVDEEVKVEEKVEEEEPTAKEEKEAAVEANEEKAEHDSLGKPIEEKGGVKEQTKEEKEAEDEAIAKGLIDFATFIDGSSFLCNDEVSGIDYSKIAMDAGPKKAPTKQNCKTTFAQCRAKNPLFCRFHGPKLLEKDIKTAISAALGKGCVVSVTKDKGNKNPLVFRLTVGCPPQMKKDVEQTIHWYMTNVPGISSPEEYKDLGNGKETTEFEMDVLKADEPPKKSETKAQVAEYEVEKATAGNKKMAVVGETPPGIEKKAANAEVSHKFGEEEPTVGGNEVGNEEPPIEKQETQAEAPKGEAENTESQQANPNVDDNLKFSQLVDEAMNKGLFDIPEFKKGYDSINWDHTTYPDTASQIKALEKLMNETDWESKKPQPTAEEKAKKEFEDEFNAALGEYPENGSNIDNDAKNVEINEAFTKAYMANDQEGMKSAIEAMKKLVADVKGEEGSDAGGDIEDVSDVEEKVKQALKGTVYENAELESDNLGDSVDIKIAATDNGELHAFVYENGGMEFSAFQNGEYKELGEDLDEAIKNFEENYGGGKKKSDFHYVDDAAMKMESEIKDLAQENPELISGDDNVSALYYAAQQAINGLDLYKRGIEEIDEMLKKFGNDEASLSASGALEKNMLESAKKNQEDAYNDAKANAEISVKDFKEAVEKAKSNIVDGVKGVQASNVEDIVKTTARAIFPKGKPADVEDVKDMVDSMFLELNESLDQKGISHESKMTTLDKYLVAEKSIAAIDANEAFDAAIRDFKSKIDQVKDENSAKGLHSAVKEISEKSKALKDAFFVYKAAVDATKKEIETSAAVEAAKKKLSQNSGNDQPSQDEILDAAKKHAIDMHSSDVEKSAAYYAEEISSVISGEGYSKNVDKEISSKGGSRRYVAKHYLHMLENLDGVSPSVISALQKVVDMPKWGEKKKQQSSTSGNALGTAKLADVPKNKKLYSYSDGEKLPYSDNEKVIEAFKKSGQKIMDGPLSNNVVSFSVDDSLTTTMDLGATYGDHNITDALKSALEEAGFKGIDIKYTKVYGSPEKAMLVIPKQEVDSSNQGTVSSQATKSSVKAKIAPMSIKEKLAGMSMKEKLPYAIKALKKKLAQDPSNADLQKKLKVYEKKLEELSKDDDHLE